MAEETLERQMSIRAAWLYFMEGLTQAEIAAMLGTTRLKINRLLSEARTNGLVHVTINSPLVSTVALERELVSRFGLEAAVIIPTPSNEDLTTSLIGKALANFLLQHLARHEITKLGMGWGHTLSEMVNHLPAADFTDLNVLAVMGGLIHGHDYNAFNIVADTAKRLNANCKYLAAPIYSSSPASRDIILKQDVFHDTFRDIAEAELFIASIGDTTSNSILFNRGLPEDIDGEQLIAAGAVAEVCGHYLDSEGRELDHPINHRAIAIPMNELRNIPVRVFAGGGVHKTQAISAILKSRLANVLICDEATARNAADMALGNAIGPDAEFFASPQK